MDLAAVALGTILLNLAVRRVLHGGWLQPESQSRVAASACALCVVASTLLYNEVFGTCTYFAYVVADTVGAVAFGPPMRLEICVHHFVTGGLCLGSALFLESGGRSMTPSTAPIARIMLLMEASNPFLHASWILNREGALQPYKWFLLPLTVPGVLTTFLWFRLVEGWRCLDIAIASVAYLSPWQTPIILAIATLFNLQVRPFCCVLHIPVPLFPPHGAQPSLHPSWRTHPTLVPLSQVYWYFLLCKLVYGGLFRNKEEGLTSATIGLRVEKRTAKSGKD